MAGLQRVTVVFNGNGTMTSVRDRFGNATTFSWSGGVNGDLTAITDPASDHVQR